MLSRMLLIIFSLLLSNFALSSEIDIKKISEQIYILKGQDYSTNIGLVSTGEGLVLIDPMPGQEQLQDLSKTIQEIYHKPIAYILNTHAHIDHSGGNDFFAQRGAKVIRDNFDIEGLLEFKVASHSSSDLVYFHAESNSVFVGDVFDSSWHPTFYAGGIDGFNEAVNTILRIGNADSLIIPGHGNPADKSALKQFQQNTVVWVEKVKVLHREGKGVEEIMENPEIDEIFRRFNHDLPEKAFERFVERTISVIDRDNGI